MPIARARIALCAALGLLGPAAIAHAAGVDQTVADILKSTRPVLDGVDYDTPTDPAALAACVREDIPPGRSGGMAKGYAVVIRDGQGRTLRRFVDVNGDVQIDVWSYYKDGFEVYRDIDYTFDKRVDESRWLNTAGTRIAVVKSLEGPDGQLHPKIVSWRRLSGQEASLVLVEALVRRDLELLSTVMATPEELADLGLPAGLVDQAKAEAAARPKAVEELTLEDDGRAMQNRARERAVRRDHGDAGSSAVENDKGVGRQRNTRTRPARIPPGRRPGRPRSSGTCRLRRRRAACSPVRPARRSRPRAGSGRP